MKMGQLFSPPNSLKAFADWLADGTQDFLNDAQPRRSLQIFRLGRRVIQVGHRASPRAGLIARNSRMRGTRMPTARASA